MEQRRHAPALAILTELDRALLETFALPGQNPWAVCGTESMLMYAISWNLRLATAALIQQQRPKASKNAKKLWLEQAIYHCRDFLGITSPDPEMIALMLAQRPSVKLDVPDLLVKLHERRHVWKKNARAILDALQTLADHGIDLTYLRTPLAQGKLIEANVFSADELEELTAMCCPSRRISLSPSNWDWYNNWQAKKKFKRINDISAIAAA